MWTSPNSKSGGLCWHLLWLLVLVCCWGWPIYGAEPDNQIQIVISLQNKLDEVSNCLLESETAQQESEKALKDAKQRLNEQTALINVQAKQIAELQGLLMMHESSQKSYIREESRQTINSFFTGAGVGGLLIGILGVIFGAFR